MIYLLRHGETEFNKLGKCQGLLDSPLTPLGRAQVSQNSVLLKHHIADTSTLTLYSSPLTRALESTKIICQYLNYPLEKVVIDERLQEVDLGEWAGHSFSELQQSYPDISLEDHDWYFKAPTGETYQETLKRCQSWLDDRQPNHCAIVISHALVGRVLRGVYANLSKAEALTLHVPQKGFFKLNHQRVTYCTDNFDFYA